MKSIFLSATVGVFALVVAACSSSDSTSGTPDTSSPTGDPGGGTNDGTGDTSGGGSTNGLHPSGALYRIVNVYDPLTATPGKVDIYPLAFALDDDQPLRSIDFGTASELYDPPVSQGGNMAVSMYPAGAKGNGRSVMSHTETLKGGEVITVVLATGPNTDTTSGRQFGEMRSYFHDFIENPMEAGKGQLVVDMLGVENVLPEKKDQEYTVKVGDQCLHTVKDTQDASYTLTPGTTGTYALAPGSYTATIVEGLDCAGTAALENAPFTIEADNRALLVVYAVRGTGFRSVTVPLTPKHTP